MQCGIFSFCEGVHVTEWNEVCCDVLCRVAKCEARWLTVLQGLPCSTVEYHTEAFAPLIGNGFSLDC